MARYLGTPSKPSSQAITICPGASWSSLEYDGRWKVLHYFARHFFAPLLVSSVEADNGGIEIWLTSDIALLLSVKLTIEMWTWDGRQLDQWSEVLLAESHSSKVVWKRQIRDLLKTVRSCRASRRCTRVFSPSDYAAGLHV